MGRAVRLSGVMAVTVGLVATTAPGAAAQVIRGRAVDAVGEVAPVPLALVKLITPDGSQVAAGLTDEDGWYVLEIPSAGEYTIEAEALGWRPYRSALFEMTGLQGVFRVDLLMVPEPVRLEGLQVDVDRLEKLRRTIHLALGRNPTSLRWAPIGRVQIMHHADRGRTIPAMLAFEAPAGILVRDRAGDVCFQFRTSCLPMYLNGMRADPSSFAHGIPLEMLEVVVLMSPGESVAYPGGGVFLYSVHWVR